jgi:7-carboxy-7-deazaguanine synthase (Cx14CxxC type)
MAYTVKELFYTLQGEGAQAGSPAVFCRFAGCNLWSGREEDRADAVCQFCDTDFVGTDGPNGGRFRTAEDLALRATEIWDDGDPVRRAARTSPASAQASIRPSALVVCTGGEPLLQLDGALIDAFHALGFRVAVETNGTQAAPAGIDWTCVSPKAGAPLLLTEGDELKLVFPQSGGDPARYESLDFSHFFLQPMDGPERERNTALALRYCLDHPRWRLSLQTHKLLGIP